MNRAATLLIVFLALSSALLACQRGAPALTLAPEALDLTAKAGAEQRAQLRVIGAAAAQLEVTASQPWLSAALVEGGADDAVVEVVARCPAAQADAVLKGSVRLASAGAERDVPVQLSCLVARISALPEDPIAFAGLLGQTQTRRLTLENPGEVPLLFTPASDADWLTVSPDAKTELAPGASAEVTLQARCAEEAGSQSTTFTLLSDAPRSPRQELAVTLGCQAQLEPEQEGLVVRAGTWNWAENDDGTLGSAMLFGFRYLASVPDPLVEVTVRGPASYNGGQPRQLTLEPPEFAPGQTSQDVWSYDLLTSGEGALASGPYQVTAVSSSGSRYRATLTLEPETFLPSPKALSVSPTTGGATVAWSEVPGAQTYFVVLSDPQDGVVPPQARQYRLSGLELQDGTIYAKTMTDQPEVMLESALNPGQAYQVTVVAFSTELLHGGTEARSITAVDTRGFSASSAALRFSYQPPEP